MKILGIDPGTATTGYGVVEGSKKTSFKYIAHGTINTSKSLEPENRLEQIHLQLLQIIQQYQPDILAIEKLFFNKNPKTAMSVSQASGVIMVTAALQNIAVEEFTPLQIKVAIGGYGRADKLQIQKMITRLLGLKEIPQPDDAADALAIALCAGVSL